MAGLRTVSTQSTGFGVAKFGFSFATAHLPIRSLIWLYQKSYLARLSYVHRNAVKHGLVRTPEAYKWCSAGWFAENSTRAQYETVMNLPIDEVNVEDDY